MDCFQKISKPELTTTIVEIAAQYFGIENGEEKCVLQSFFDFYSTLVGMRATIDAYDLTKSGFANDLEDCAQIYWSVENYGGMQDDDLRKFLDRASVKMKEKVVNAFSKLSEKQDHCDKR